jgi:Flp pilus assembly protein TadB
MAEWKVDLLAIGVGAAILVAYVLVPSPFTALGFSVVGFVGATIWLRRSARARRRSKRRAVGELFRPRRTQEHELAPLGLS